MPESGGVRGGGVVRRLPAVGAKRATIETVARHSGFSRQTISNAINAPDRLRPETLHKALKAIDELGYRPSQAARSLRIDATNVIGCRLLPSNHGGTGGVLDGWFHAICAAARSSSYDVLTYAASTDDEEIEVFDDLLRRRAVDGFVLTNTHYLDPRPAWLHERRATFVAFGRPWGAPNAPHSWVDVDGASGTADAVAHLADLGHSRIGFLGLTKDKGVGDDRYQGWASAMRNHGLSTKGLVARAEDGIASGRALTGKLLDAPEPPTGLVCVSDSMAVGAVRAVEDRGLLPGQDLCIIGFDDSPIASLLRPGLSSVRQPIVAVAGELVGALLAELSDNSPRPSRILLSPRLVVRASSGAPPGDTELYKSEREPASTPTRSVGVTQLPRPEFSANA